MSQLAPPTPSDSQASFTPEKSSYSDTKKLGMSTVRIHRKLIKNTNKLAEAKEYFFRSCLLISLGDADPGSNWSPVWGGSVGLAAGLGLGEVSSREVFLTVWGRRKPTLAPLFLLGPILPSSFPKSYLATGPPGSGWAPLDGNLIARVHSVAAQLLPPRCIAASPTNVLLSNSLLVMVKGPVVGKTLLAYFSLLAHLVPLALYARCTFYTIETFGTFGK